MVIGHTTGSAHCSLPVFLPPSLAVPRLLTYCIARRRTQTNTHTHWHLWLQWLPSSGMKSYFCFQITDCQSNKWICSHQRCEIDILFSNFNLYSREVLWGRHSHNNLFIYFFPPSILLAVRQWDVAAVCQKGLIFHLSSSLLENVAKSHSDEHLLCVYRICMNGVKLAVTPPWSFGISHVASVRALYFIFSFLSLVASALTASTVLQNQKHSCSILLFITRFVYLFLLFIYVNMSR